MLSATSLLCEPLRRVRVVLRAGESGDGADQLLRAKIRRAAVTGAGGGAAAGRGVGCCEATQRVQHRAAAARAQSGRFNLPFFVCAHAHIMACTQTVD